MPWAVTPDMVGAILRARTVDTNGAELGTFNGDTRPTADQVEDLIVTATDEVEVAVAVAVPEELQSAAEVLVTYRSAMLVELSYFPEQVATGRSPYEQLKILYDDFLRRLIAKLTGVVDTGDGGTGEPVRVPSPPAYAFPTMSTLDHLLGPSLDARAAVDGGSLYQ